jgi:hypothetical protein
LSIHKNIKNNDINLHSEGDDNPLIDKKLDELITLVYNGADTEKAKRLKTTIKQAIKDAALFNTYDDKNEFSIMLSRPQSNSMLLKRYLQGESISKYILIGLSAIMIILGLGMIIMPAPPFFEMFTIFYFNRNDGITIMDLISLIIILAGVYFLIKGIYKNPSLQKFMKNYNK